MNLCIAMGHRLICFFCLSDPDNGCMSFTTVVRHLGPRLFVCLFFFKWFKSCLIHLSTCILLIYQLIATPILPSVNNNSYIFFCFLAHLFVQQRSLLSVTGLRSSVLLTVRSSLALLTLSIPIQLGKASDCDILCGALILEVGPLPLKSKYILGAKNILFCIAPPWGLFHHT